MHDFWTKDDLTYILLNPRHNWWSSWLTMLALRATCKDFHKQADKDILRPLAKNLGVEAVTMRKLLCALQFELQMMDYIDQVASSDAAAAPLSRWHRPRHGRTHAGRVRAAVQENMHARIAVRGAAIGSAPTILTSCDLNGPILGCGRDKISSSSVWMRTISYADPPSTL